MEHMNQQKQERSQPSSSEKMTMEELLKKHGGTLGNKTGAILMPLSKGQREAMQKLKGNKIMKKTLRKLNKILKLIAFCFVSTIFVGAISALGFILFPKQSVEGYVLFLIYLFFFTFFLSIWSVWREKD